MQVNNEANYFLVENNLYLMFFSITSPLPTGRQAQSLSRVRGEP